MVVQKPNDIQYQKYQDFVESQLGIDWSKGKQYLLHGRLNSRLYELGLDYDEYFQVLQDSKNKGELQYFYNLVTTTKTEFYRDPALFDWFRENVIPEYFHQINTGKREKIRIWSVGCSTGEEAYTLAFETDQLAQLLSRTPEGFKILASDVNTDVLFYAIQGVYDENQLQTIPRPVQGKHFRYIKNGNKNRQLQVREHIKQRIEFRILNLLDSRYPIATKFEVIFCRNVLYYFNNETRTMILDKLVEFLTRDGYLILGGTETGHQVEGATKIRHNVFKKK